MEARCNPGALTRPGFYLLQLEPPSHHPKSPSCPSHLAVAEGVDGREPLMPTQIIKRYQQSSNPLRAPIEGDHYGRPFFGPPLRKKLRTLAPIKCDVAGLSQLTRQVGFCPAKT